MILLFLGSWRSTLIIVISIPLAILFSLSLLSATGQTLNMMTLGGLALAVGILVDDATVTIENINWHLEQGKSVPAGDPRRRPADRGASLRLAALHLHRFRADVLPARRFRLSVHAHGDGGGVRADRLLHPVAHSGATRWPAISWWRMASQKDADVARSPRCEPRPSSQKSPGAYSSIGFETRFDEDQESVITAISLS